MKVGMFATVLVAVSAFSGSAQAAPACTTAPQAQWMPQEAMKARVAKLGYKVKTFKVSGNCYEIYGWTRDGKKAEVYFNPVNGAVVKSKVSG